MRSCFVEDSKEYVRAVGGMNLLFDYWELIIGYYLYPQEVEGCSG